MKLICTKLNLNSFLGIQWCSNCDEVKKLKDPPGIVRSFEQNKLCILVCECVICAEYLLYLYMRIKSRCLRFSAEVVQLNLRLAFSSSQQRASFSMFCVLCAFEFITLRVCTPIHPVLFANVSIVSVQAYMLFQIQQVFRFSCTLVVEIRDKLVEKSVVFHSNYQLS